MTSLTSESNTWVSWIISCSCKPESFDEISNLALKMTQYFKTNEPDTTNFEISVNADHDQIHVHERYLTSSQALSHMKAFGDLFGAEFMSLLTPKQVVVYGYPNPELSAALDALSPIKMTNFRGFTR